MSRNNSKLDTAVDLQLMTGLLTGFPSTKLLIFEPKETYGCRDKNQISDGNRVSSSCETDNAFFNKVALAFTASCMLNIFFTKHLLYKILFQVCKNTIFLPC